MRSKTQNELRAAARFFTEAFSQVLVMFRALPLSFNVIPSTMAFGLSGSRYPFIYSPNSLRMNFYHLVEYISKNDKLFCRYASAIIKNNAAAEQIIIKVFEEYYASGKERSGKELRTYLHASTKQKCFQWLSTNYPILNSPL